MLEAYEWHVWDLQLAPINSLKIQKILFQSLGIEIIYQEKFRDMCLFTINFRGYGSLYSLQLSKSFVQCNPI